MPTTITVNLPSPERAELNIDSLRLALNAHEVDGLIGLLTNARAAMQPLVSLAPVPPGTPLMVTAGPAMRVDPDAMLGGVILQIRHPGLGWLPFQIPYGDVGQLCELLTRCCMPLENSTTSS